VADFDWRHADGAVKLPCDVMPHRTGVDSGLDRFIGFGIDDFVAVSQRLSVSALA
jgi:hypothetical protein